jgi:hypothetical protein
MTSNPSTSSAEDFPASQFRLPVEAEPRTTFGGSGPSTPDWFADYDPDSSSWRTSQGCLFEGSATFSETWPSSGMTRSGRAFRLPPLVPRTSAGGSSLWPTPTVSDTMGTTEFHPRKEAKFETLHAVTLAQVVQHRRIWPTPTVQDSSNCDGPPQFERHSLPLNAAVQTPSSSVQWGTPTAHPRTHTPRQVDHGVALANQVGGRLNPTWLAWLMGFPANWLSLPSEGSATP